MNEMNENFETKYDLSREIEADRGELTSPNLRNLLVSYLNFKFSILREFLMKRESFQWKKWNAT